MEIGVSKEPHYTYTIVVDFPKNEQRDVLIERRYRLIQVERLTLEISACGPNRVTIEGPSFTYKRRIPRDDHASRWYQDWGWELADGSGLDADQWINDLCAELEAKVRVE